MERMWKLGVDLDALDNLLDPITFEQLILAVHCNCREITTEAVMRELREMFESNRQDMFYLVEKNMAEIIAAAKKGRAQYEEKEK